MRYASITSRLAGLGSGKWEVHFAARRMKAEGREVIELTIGEPDVPTPPALLDVCASAMRGGRTRYAAGAGEAALLAALSEKYTRRTGRVVSPVQILAFPGTQSALYAVMLGLVETGDEVIVGDPLYATYEGVIRATGADMVTVPLRREKGFHLQAEDVAAAVTGRTRAILLNSPHNPTGAVLTARDIAAIGAVAAAHDLWIVSDEVYEELIFDGTPFASPLDDEVLAERSVAVSSISKSHAAPGFRSGWAVGPAPFCAQLLPVSETMLFGSQPFIADMTAAAVAAPSEAAATMRQAYARRAELVAGTLAGGPAEALTPEGGMFALVDIAATGVDSEAFALTLLAAEAVAVMPGASFGEGGRQLLRLSLTVPDATLAEACRRIARHAARVAGREAVEA